MEVIRVRSAAEMQRAILPHAADADVIVMAAAVADYTPDRGRVSGKIEKGDGPMELRLVGPSTFSPASAPRAARPTPVLVGFAAESGDPVARGREKLNRKKVDLIVANDISPTTAGFEFDNNAVTIIGADGAEARSTRAEVADCRRDPGPGRARSSRLTKSQSQPRTHVARSYAFSQNTSASTRSSASPASAIAT